MIVRSEDGTLIYCECHRAPKARGALLVVHGLGEHSARYQELVRVALEQKLDVHLFDLRGHGRSTGTRGHFSLEGIHADMDAWIKHLVEAGELRKELPCFLLGHSLGGLVALTFMGHYQPGPLYPPIDGLVLSSPAIGLAKSALRLVEGQVARRIPKFLQSIQVPNGIPFEALTHDTNEIARLSEDALMHRWITPAAFLSMEKGMASLPKLIPQLDMPLLFLLGGKDPVVSAAAAESFAKKCAVAHPGKVEVKVFHNFLHEPFHELKRDRAFLEFKKWILRWLPKSPSRTTPFTPSSSKSSAKKATAKATSRSPRAKKAAST
jgi:alpha-beta hydrolase superfamily lysophospholipase